MEIGIINIITTSYCFRDDGPMYQHFRDGRISARPSTRISAAALSEFAATLRVKSVWLLSFFFHLGAGITAGGWVVEFLHVVRGGHLSLVGYTSAVFYGGIAFGRFVLAEPTFRFGEKRMVLLYTLAGLTVEIVFWRVSNSNIVVGTVMISILNFFLGPLMATGVSVGSKLFPRELQSSALGTSTTP